MGNIIPIRSMVDDYFEELTQETEKSKRKQFEEEHNIKRDKKGRLNEGAILAKKDNCDELSIIIRYKSGMPVKEIVKDLNCSKSTVYNVISKYKKQQATILEKTNQGEKGNTNEE